jgi:adenylosuccinate synthase
MKELGRARQAIVVVGLGYGDESKGATVDYLASVLDDTVAVVRWSGGAQAAHNVRHGPRHHTFRQFGSASLLDVRTILRAPMLVNPLLLDAEADELAALGVHDPLGLIAADPACLVTTPIHAAMNQAREILRGAARHGSTGLGIGETVAYDLAVRGRARRGDVVGNFPCPADAPSIPALRVGDLRDRRATVAALDALARYADPILASVDDSELVAGAIGFDTGTRPAPRGPAQPAVGDLADRLMGVAREIEILDDADRALGAALGSGTVIFEGSQGVLLDEWHGFHPHTTWATVTPRGLVAELAAAGHDPYVLGLTRTYATRHGAGPMPTEDAALDLPEPDNGPGLYQGNWRVGHLDLPALRYASKVAGRVDGVGVSHLDVLAASKKWPVTGDVERVGGVRAREIWPVTGDARSERDGVWRVKVARSWSGDPDPLALAGPHDLAALEGLTARAFAARPDLEPLPGEENEVLALIADAVDAPVVLTAQGPQRSHRSLR